MLKESVRVAKFAKKLKEYQSASDEIAKEKALTYLNDLLGNDGGILTKALQYMGTKNSDLVPNHQKSTGFSLDPSEVNKILAENFAEHEITNIESSAFLASVGQVNIGALGDQKVAIKTQYPGIKDKFKDQLRLLNLLGKTSEQTKFKKWGMDFGSFQKNFEKLIDAECDYLNEVKNIKRWNSYEDSLQLPFFKTPRVIDNYSAKGIYVQDFIDGLSIDEVVKEWSDEDKKKLSDNILNSYLSLLFNFQEIQGDTNHGNFLFDDNQNVYFIDLGQVIKLENTEIVKTLYLGVKSIIEGRSVNALGFFKGLGFDETKLKHIQGQLELLMEVLLEPLVSKFAMKLSDWKYQEKIDLILGENKWWFRSSGSVEFFNFMKSFMGVKNLLVKLDQSVYCRKILISLFDKNLFPDQEIKEVKLDSQYTQVFKANNLQVLVLEKGQEKVRVTLPFHAIFDLDEFIDPDIKNKILEQGFNMKELVHNALIDGGSPKNIFSLEVGHKQYSIDLLE